MSESRSPHLREVYNQSAPENYERYFVPVIAEPLAAELVEKASLKPGEHVLDVACGTGVVARMAAGRVGADGRVVATDINPGMLGVARSIGSSATSIEWREATAKELPFPGPDIRRRVLPALTSVLPGQVGSTARDAEGP